MASVIERQTSGMSAAELLAQRNRNDAAKKTNQLSDTLITPGAAIKENTNYRNNSFTLSNATYPGFNLTSKTWTNIQGLGETQINTAVEFHGYAKSSNVWYVGTVLLGSGSNSTFSDCKFSQTVTAELNSGASFLNCTFLPPTTDAYAYVNGLDPTLTGSIFVIGGQSFTSHVNVTTFGTVVI